MKKEYLLSIIIIFTSFHHAQSPTYLDPNASIDNRVNDLIERMTIANNANTGSSLNTR